MAEVQAKLRRAFPELVSVLFTGDRDHDFVADGKVIESLRIAVVTSDMGVLGVGADGTGAVPTCGAESSPADRWERAHYGADGRFRTQMVSIPADPPASPFGLDCDYDATPGDDVIEYDFLSQHLRFDSFARTDLDAAELAEFDRRIACNANVGTSGCAFAQPLEAVLKAITPSTETPNGGAFHAAASDVGVRDHGRGDDRATNDANPGGDEVGGFRDESMIVVSNDDDCSARDPGVFDLANTTDPLWSQDGADAPARSSTRCSRFESEGLWPVSRYVEGLIARRASFPNRFVFAAIAGVPPDLTDGDGEGIDDLQTILDDSRMQVAYVPNGSVANGRVRPACEHVDDATRIAITHDAATASTSLTGVSGSGPLALSPLGTVLVGDGVPDGTQVLAIAGTGPYVLTLDRAITVDANTSLSLATRDVSAAPGRRLVRVAQGLSDATHGAGALVQSLCVDTFGPAMVRLAQVIQANL